MTCISRHAYDVSKAAAVCNLTGASRLPEDAATARASSGGNLLKALRDRKRAGMPNTPDILEAMV